MTIDRRTLAGAVAALLLVAACGGSASTAPTTAPTAAATPVATAPAETATPTAVPTEPAETAGPSFVPGAAGALEAMLPSQVGDVTFERSSFDGSTYPGTIPLGEGDDELNKLLTENGKTLKDVRIAVATPTDSGAAGTIVMAIQVAGIPSDKLLAFALESMGDLEKTTLGGKQVYGQSAGGFGAHVYIKDDVLFYVLALGGQDLTEGILKALP